jgi:flagellar biosynthesis anti-sigma factor FlgM
MEIRNNAEALKAFLGVSPSSSAPTSHITSSDNAIEQASIVGDRATLSKAGAQVSESASQTGVRADKVAAIQRALETGTYDVPASAVADKMIASMIVAGMGQRS